MLLPSHVFIKSSRRESTEIGYDYLMMAVLICKLVILAQLASLPYIGLLYY